MRMRKQAALSAAMAVGVVASFPAVASATFPGGNGYIYFGGSSPGFVDTDIWRVRPDGSGLENLTETLDEYVEGPSVSLNAKKVAFTMGTQAASDVWVMDGDGSNPDQVTSSPPAVPVQGLDQMPAISPDGELVAFMSTRDTDPMASGLDYDIYTVPSSGGIVSQLINRTSEEYNPDFAPDGETVVLQGEVSGPYDIVKTTITGAPHTDYTSITPGTGLQERVPSVSPDGSEVLFNISTTDISKVGINGGTITPVLDDDVDSYGSPAWSPDGERIVFSGSGGGGGGQLLVSDADGENIEEIPLDEDVVIGPSAPAWAADTKKPKAKITDGPEGTTSKTKAKFKFKSNEKASTFKCKLDSGAFKSCEPGVDYKNLDNGKHTFQVRATDFAGNTGKPKKREWKVAG